MSERRRGTGTDASASASGSASSDADDRPADHVQADHIQADVEQVADALYALTPEDFSAARDAAVRQARADRKPALARELSQLHKPTQSAWLINLLWRDQHDVIEQLFELAQELGRAQAEAAGPALRELMAQRRQLESALTQQAVALAQQAGVRVSDTVIREAQDTLGAAMARPEVADAVRAGRLVKPATYAGFGVAPGSSPPARQVPPPGREPIDLQAQRARRAATPGAATGAAEDAAREAAEAEADAAAGRRLAEQRRAAAEQRVAQARQVLERTAATLAETTRLVETTTRRRDDLQTQRAALREQLQRLEAQVDRAARDANAALAAQPAAERAAVEARQMLEQAEAGLDAARKESS